MATKFTKALVPMLLLVSVSAMAADAPPICAPKKYEMALRYQQKSAEILALQLQTYRFATERFEQKLHTLTSPEKYAVVMDLDETVLDNSPLLVREIEHCQDFSTWGNWEDWEKHGNPTLIPGSKDFLDAVDKAKVNIFYVSDRTQTNKADTIKTLKSLGLPQVSQDHVLLDTESKEARRQAISKNYQIIMLFGDSLADLAVQFKNKEPTEAQRKLVEASKAHFGDDWIVLPNASYGTWSNATLNPWQKK